MTLGPDVLEEKDEDDLVESFLFLEASWRSIRRSPSSSLLLLLLLLDVALVVSGVNVGR